MVFHFINEYGAGNDAVIYGHVFGSSKTIERQKI